MIKNISFHMFLMLLPSLAWSWIPCTPFCDAACGGAALGALGASVSSSMQTQGSANQQVFNGIKDVAQGTAAFGTSMAEAWTSTTLNNLSSLEAITARIELAQTMQLKGREFSTDLITQGFSDGIKNKFITEAVSQNIGEFSDYSAPETGEIGVLAANDIKRSYIMSHQHAEKMAISQKIFAEELTASDRSLATAKKSAKPDEIYESQIIFCQQTFSEAELSNMQNLITYITNQTPLPILGDKYLYLPSVQDYELERKVFNGKVSWVAAIVNEIIASRGQFASADWVRSYASRTSNEPKLSISESLNSLIRGRVTSDGWFLNIKSMNETGLQREMTYLKAEENALYFLLSQRREWRNQLLAMIAVGKLGKQAKEMQSGP